MAASISSSSLAACCPNIEPHFLLHSFSQCHTIAAAAGAVGRSLCQQHAKPWRCMLHLHLHLKNHYGNGLQPRAGRLYADGNSRSNLNTEVSVTGKNTVIFEKCKLPLSFSCHCFGGINSSEGEMDSHAEAENPFLELQTEECEWSYWQQVFQEVEHEEKMISTLKLLLEDAIQNEDFQQAAKIKATLIQAKENDTIIEVMRDLKAALVEERYNDASMLRDMAGVGLVGWWAGLAEDGSDPYGRIIQIMPAHGRLIAKNYTARHLATARGGIPLFEVFVRKDEKQHIQKQVVYLGDGTKRMTSAVMSSTEAYVDDGVHDTIKKVTTTLEDSPKLEDNGLNQIVNFIKSRLPDFKLKPVQEFKADVTRILEASVYEENQSKGDDKSGTSTGNETDQSPGERSNELVDQIQKRRPAKLVIGGVLEGDSEEKSLRSTIRLPAKLEYKGRDSFIFHLEDSSINSLTESLSSWKVATIVAQASANLMPDDVAKALWNIEKPPAKVPTKEMARKIRLALTQAAQQRHHLPNVMTFRRLNVTNSTMDPLSGLYIGAFGPYASEVVQLKRCCQETRSGENLELFDHVEAIKLTGDANVPAGEVAFRATTEEQNHLSCQIVFPEELGVVARYKGQGRIAEPGHRNPQWIDGEMVILDGKFGGHTYGAELGFVYYAPERHFLVLFNRLKLEVEF